MIGRKRYKTLTKKVQNEEYLLVKLKKVVHFDWSQKVQNVVQKSTKRKIPFTEIEKSIVHFDWSEKVQNVRQKST